MRSRTILRVFFFASTAAGEEALGNDCLYPSEEYWEPRSAKWRVVWPCGGVRAIQGRFGVRQRTFLFREALVEAGCCNVTAVIRFI